MRSSQKGVTLLELLVALALFAVAAPLVANALFQGVRSAAKVRASIDARRAEDRLFARLEADLRNALPLSQAAFIGDADRFSFPLAGSLKRVTYEAKNGALLRSESDLKGGDASRTFLGDDVEKFSVEYAYADPSGKITFLPYWTKEPYAGLPRAVRVRMVRSGGVSESLVTLPQGHFGKAGE